MAVKALTRKQWTFMVYLAGDNNLDGNGLMDLAEMKQVGSTDELNLIAQFDRAGSRRQTKRFYLRKGTTLAKDAVAQLPEGNTGDPGALKDFITWGITHYPALRYALILWNHGGGWDDTDVYADSRRRRIQRAARGKIRHSFFLSNLHSALRTAAAGAKPRAILYDDDAKDFLDNLELKKVLTAARKTAGRKIDILGMDACLMSMAEVVCQVRQDVRFTIGSEQTEPLDGWPYHKLLSTLAQKPSATAESFASLIVDRYIASYPPSESITQSACDLTRSTALMDAAGKLTCALCDGMKKDAVRLAIMQARARVQSYEVRDNIDLADFCKLLIKDDAPGEVVRCACRKVMDAVCGPDGIVIRSARKGAAVKNSYGLAIYFPTLDPSPLYSKLDFSKKTGWGKFLQSYSKISRQR